MALIEVSAKEKEEKTGSPVDSAAVFEWDFALSGATINRFVALLKTSLYILRFIAFSLFTDKVNGYRMPFALNLASVIKMNNLHKIQTLCYGLKSPLAYKWVCPQINRIAGYRLAEKRL